MTYERNEYFEEVTQARRKKLAIGMIAFFSFASFVVCYSVTSSVLQHRYNTSDSEAVELSTAVVAPAAPAASEPADTAFAASALPDTPTPAAEEFVSPPAPTGPFQEHFSGDLSLEEVERATLSDSDDWWLRSGAFVHRSNDMGHTVSGDLIPESPWFDIYGRENSSQTDGGKKPQNLFRLIKRGAWLNTSQEVYFRIDRYNVSDDSDRDASNGLLLFSRYQDQDNLYYAGLRVDGNAVIKRKVGGSYKTLLQKPFITDRGVYDRENNPSLLPVDEWIGVRTDIRNQSDGTTKISLFIDARRDYNWELVGEVVDDGRFGGPIVTDYSQAGIRTDFMDVTFDEYRIREL